MNYQIELTEKKSQKALVVRKKVKIETAGESIGGAISKVENYLKNLNSEPQGAPFTRTLCFEKGVIEFEAGFPVEKGVVGFGDICATELPEGQMATTVHEGNPDESEKAYQALHVWMNSNSKSEAGAPWEVYLSDNSSSIENLRMQIFYPVK